MEGSAFESHLETWSAQATSMYPDRKLPTVVATANGKTACITRFFKPFAPPGILLIHTLENMNEINN
jgi:hypothetical protein